jgi:membrane protease YdiL (CAAX protease family)
MLGTKKVKRKRLAASPGMRAAGRFSYCKGLLTPEMPEEPIITPEVPAQERISAFGLLLRAGFFVLLIWISGTICGIILHSALDPDPQRMTLLSAALGMFIPATLASTFVVRIYERGRLEDIGMGWSPASLRQFWAGTGASAAAALLVIGGAWVTHLASFEKIADPKAAFNLGQLIFVGVLLLFGAVGEELMFRGYAFQLLAGSFGPWRVIPAFGVLFAIAHLANLGSWWLGTVNTGLWGLLLGYAMWRSGALWLPIGLHFGWNFVLPLAGARLSGFTLGLTGYELKWKAAVWLSGGEYGPEGSVLTTGACVLLLAWLWRGRIHHQPSLLLDQKEPLNPPGDDPA